jgi:hypothetical protein
MELAGSIISPQLAVIVGKTMQLAFNLKKFEQLFFLLAQID